MSLTGTAFQPSSHGDRGQGRDAGTSRSVRASPHSVFCRPGARSAAGVPRGSPEGFWGPAHLELASKEESVKTACSRLGVSR